MRHLHTRRHVREDFYRIDRLVGDLHFYYRGNRYDRHGRHDGHYDRPYRSSHGRVGIYWPRFDIHWRW